MCVDFVCRDIAAMELQYCAKRPLFVLVLRFFVVLSDKKLKDLCVFSRINRLEERFLILKSLWDV